MGTMRKVWYVDTGRGWLARGIGADGEWYVSLSRFGSLAGARDAVAKGFAAWVRA